MSLKPVVLWTPRFTLTSDEACTSILQYKLPPAPITIPTPYNPPSKDATQDERNTKPALSYLPPLIYFCIRALIDYPDQIHRLGPARLRYECPLDRNDFDILQALIPSYRPFSPDHEDFDMRVVDPRLWSVLVQIYEDLPSVFRAYTLPLSDVHMPLLQTIPSTQHFALITVLSLAKCRELTDDTVVELRHLHTLSALDASVTGLSSWGLQRLAKTLSWSEGDEEHPVQRRGPWGIRVLYLRDCINIDDKVLSCLPRFPLLSVVDLRGTVCKPWKVLGFPFESSADARLFAPDSLPGVLNHLASLSHRPSAFFSHSKPFILNVDTPHHQVNPTPPFRLSSNSLWEFEEHAGEIARRRMDVFLPYKPPREALPPHHMCDCDECCASGSGDEDEDDSSQRSDEEEDTEGYLEPQSRGPSFYEGSDSEDEWGNNILPRLSPQEPDPYEREYLDRMEYAAEREREAFRRQHGADKFYTVSGPKRTSYFPTVVGHVLAAPSDTQPTNPLMLFREPALWSALPSLPPDRRQELSTSSAPRTRATMPTSVFSSAPSSAGHGPVPLTVSPAKRRRVEGVAPTDQARKRMHALSSLQNMFSMVQKRADDQSKARAPALGSTQAASGSILGRTNPFARNAQSSTSKPTLTSSTKTRPADSSPTAPVSMARVPSITAKLPPSDIRVSSTSSAGAANDPSPATAVHPRNEDATGSSDIRKRPSTGTSAKSDEDCSAPPRPAKKFKPISTLPIPEWPTPNMRPLSAHKPNAFSLAKASAASSSSSKTASIQMARQTRQPEHLSKKPAKREGRRVSAPRGMTRGLEISPAKDSETGKVGENRSKSKTKDRKTESRRPSKGFDWKGWSGS